MLLETGVRADTPAVQWRLPAERGLGGDGHRRGRLGVCIAACDEKHTRSAKPEYRSISASAPHAPTTDLPLPSNPIHEARVLAACGGALGDANGGGTSSTPVPSKLRRSCGERTEDVVQEPVEWEFLTHPLFVEHAYPASHSPPRMDMSGIWPRTLGAIHD
ncbi:hypothetical protein JB92DRAFT_2838372 [Gautieria morchelliformis]|nr:hypothetical protein JB92DRAFT_2838372 [Gautieria morchelliformis]